MTVARTGLRVLVRGAGIVGLAVAEELLRRGHDVTVVDPAPGSGASHAAAGMLTPACEVGWGEGALLDLGVRGARLWPAYARRLGVPLRTTGTLLVGLDHGDLQEVERQAAVLGSLGRGVDVLDARAVRDAEPGLGRVAGGALLADDHAVDPRAVVTALRERVPVLPQVPAGPPTADVVVLATGARLPAPYDQLVRGVRGEILRVRSDDPPGRVVRGWVRGEPVYLVPRAAAASGTTPGPGATTGVEVVVGATSEEHDAPPVVTVGGVGRLLDAARAMWPAVERAELVEACARDRPATPDHLPLVGAAPATDVAPAPRVVLAAGHFRHGVLLAPLTAALVADHLETGRVEPALDPARLRPPTEGATPCPTSSSTERP
ncbi:FAD-dependent oxidoreductase [Nocardioides zeae]|uniref:FAD-dependent oxidoreductase n=1 Tax=Nocardioides imazamoxiresistens TaxID=3231893 RepID=A0ABU3PYW3_9ACTN|nr:FAD-dependent oxidoreductase [Nocardioides zeae]MDT9594448.1 FAD-dependent oxidoreductase [Nocardioides zeae]